MANRFYSPSQQFADAAGAPYAGGFLYFYATGTSTPLNTYTDSALTIANTNPIVLDSAGRAGNVFLQNLAYKVILKDVNGVQIWTADPVATSDFTAVAQFNSGTGSPNGSVAGTAGSAGIPASVYWDATNNILYVCTTTGTASTAVWTAVNASTAAAVVPQPQGYLTLTSGTPVIPGDVAAATAVYYTPYNGNLVPIYNGATFVPTAFTEQTLSLVSSHVASNLYDVFMFSNSGVPTIVTGPTWSAGTSGSITAGSCARGTGAGGTALARVNGILTNAVQISARNGSTTYTVNANTATYLGSIFMDGTNGQVSCYRSWGQTRKWGIWNAFNRQSIVLQGGDSTASWTYASATVRASNANSANKCTVFCGLAEEEAAVSFIQTGDIAASTADYIGIGVNSTTVASGYHGSAASVATSDVGEARYAAAPTLGIQDYQMVESAPTSMTLNGTSTSMVMMARYRG